MTANAEDVLKGKKDKNSLFRKMKKGSATILFQRLNTLSLVKQYSDKKESFNDRMKKITMLQSDFQLDYYARMI